MNIVTPFPVNIPLNTSNVNTEAARRDNLQRETVPKLTQGEKSAAETGVGSESDRVKTPGQTPQPVTYEKPQPQQSAPAEGGQNKDNGEDPSAGKENAESKQQEQQKQAQADEQKIKKLETRDREVRAHEQAHAAAGGQYAGAPSYDFEVGPNGQQYAVGGEVSIDISEEKTPEATLRKMQQVLKAALAPVDPSAQDLRVAAEATQKAADARAEIAKSGDAVAQKAFDSAFSPEKVTQQSNVPELNEIVRGSGAGAAQRSLHEEVDAVAEAVGLEKSSADFKQELARDASIDQRAGRIADFYQQVSSPKGEGFRQTA